eukprot:54312-Hanusia_phi.AAC.1
MAWAAAQTPRRAYGSLGSTEAQRLAGPGRRRADRRYGGSTTVLTVPTVTPAVPGSLAHRESEPPWGLPGPGVGGPPGRPGASPGTVRSARA